MNLLDSVNILGDILTGKSTNKTTNTKKNNMDDINVYNSNKVKKGYQYMNECAINNNKRKESYKNMKKLNKSNKYKRGIRQENLGNVNYESDSEFSDNASSMSSNSVISISNDPNLLVNQTHKILDNRFHERQFQNKNFDDTFLNQYEPMKYDMKQAPSSSNAVHRSDSGISRLQAERDLAMNGGYSNFGDSKNMTYGMVSEDNLIHNNMIPQFKSATYGSDVLFNQNRNSISQRKMENFTGNISTKIPKTEQKPLFSPLLGITNIYGMPSITNLIEDRYAPGRERKNELPFKQERITPGLNLGYNEVNKNGDNFRALPKTIDELRTLDKQQKTYTTPVVEGIRGTRGPIIGDVKKYKPERTKYWGNDRLLPSLGYIRAPAIYGEYNKENMATINRGTTDKTQLGPAQSEIQQAMPENQREKYKIDFKQNFSQAGPRNVMLVEGLKGREESNKYLPDPTQRGKNQNYIGPLGTSQVTKGNAFDMITNIFDLTKRNLTENTDRIGVSIGTSEQNKTISINYNDIMDPTLRDIHSKTDRSGISIGTSEQNKTRSINYNDIMDPTLRDIHSKMDRSGFLKGDRTGTYSINYTDYTPDQTMREITSKTDRAGVVTGKEEKSYNINYINYTPDQTMREIHSKTDRAGIINGDRGSDYTINYVNYTPDQTMREIHSKTDRNGNIMGDKNQNYAINYVNYTPDQTMREIHSKTDRNGNIMGDKNQNYAINYINYTPDQTMREIHSKVDRSAAGASGVYLATRTRDDANNSIVNIQREVISKGRAPTNSKYNKGPVMDFTTVTLCEPIQIKRDLMSSTIAINEKLPFILTQTPAGRVISNTRTNEFTQKVLNKNPYINNIVHKSVEY